MAQRTCAVEHRPPDASRCPLDAPPMPPDAPLRASEQQAGPPLIPHHQTLILLLLRRDDLDLHRSYERPLASVSCETYPATIREYGLMRK
ncbi:hypothetical protein EYF80_059130 [Liparis tanakae]|uniref:Uncharacterized protein n=1 Tax=Liparis tanakae TaxID=230148 RepID=A0A4Z2EPH9_9TELE|nr:hypothetical protein EYF80_059130 [Liparis tanakae]